MTKNRCRKLLETKKKLDTRSVIVMWMYFEFFQIKSERKIKWKFAIIATFNCTFLESLNLRTEREKKL